MINVIEKLNKGQTYSWGMLHTGDIIKSTKWTAENDYALVVNRTESAIIIYRFGLGSTQNLRSSDCPGESFYKYNADFVITEKI